MKKSILYGMMASLFFAFTFILNSSMNLSGGNWMWSASLRYFFMLPLLACLLLKQQRIHKVLNEIKKSPLTWFIWSTVGFGLFYAPLTFASTYGASWLVAGCWQITIVCGILLSPLFGHKLPVKNVLLSGMILLGVAVLQFEQASSINLNQALLSIIPIIIAAFAYPLGNRKMMQVCRNKLTTTERVFGMTLCSIPFWLVIAVIATLNSGLPSQMQLLQSFIVAVFSGVIATILFFKATHLVKDHPGQLAIIEATQSGEVIFSVLGEILILGGTLPGPVALIGLLLIIIGMIVSSFASSH